LLYHVIIARLADLAQVYFGLWRDCEQMLEQLAIAGT
jgi:hypothetical protein